MNYRILDSYNIDKKKFVLFILSVSISVFTISLFITLQLIGETGIIVSTFISLTSGYIVATEPLRDARYKGLIQSSEAGIFSSFINTSNIVSGSRTRPILLLHSEDFSFSNELKEVKRFIMLGNSLETSFGRIEKRVFSSSLFSSITSYVSRSGRRRIEYEYEYSSYLSSSMIEQETKVPIFVAVVFFSPILLTFLSVIAHIYSTIELFYLFLLNLLLSDVAYFYSSTERGIIQ